LTLDCTPECILTFMPSIHNGGQLTFQIGELAKRVMYIAIFSAPAWAAKALVKATADASFPFKAESEQK
jgi:hypothetical protein